MISEIINGNNHDILPNIVNEYKHRSIVIVSDPPFNVGYHYNTYKDKMSDDDYYSMLSDIFSLAPSVVIHYPESLYKLAFAMGG